MNTLKIPKSGRLALEAKVYDIDEPINLFDGESLIGNGAVIRMTTDKDTIVAAGNSIAVKDCRLETYDAPPKNTRYCVRAENCIGLTIRDVEMYGPSSVEWSHRPASMGLLIHECRRVYVDQCLCASATGGYGFLVRRSRDVFLPRCAAHNNYNDGFKVGTLTDHIVLRDCTSHNNGKDGYDFTQGRNIHLINSSATGNKGNAVTIKNSGHNPDDAPQNPGHGYDPSLNAYGVRVHGCTLARNTKNGIFFEDLDTDVPYLTGCDISCNRIVDNGANGIVIGGGDVSWVRHNVVLRNAQRGIFFNPKCRGWEVEKNVVAANTLGQIGVHKEATQYVRVFSNNRQSAQDIEKAER